MDVDPRAPIVLSAFGATGGTCAVPLSAEAFAKPVQSVAKPESLESLESPETPLPIREGSIDWQRRLWHAQRETDQLLAHDATAHVVGCEFVAYVAETSFRREFGAVMDVTQRTRLIGLLREVCMRVYLASPA